MEFIDISQHIKRSQLLYLVLFYYSCVPAIENRNPLEVCIRRIYVNVPLGMDHNFLRHFAPDYWGVLMQIKACLPDFPPVPPTFQLQIWN